MHNIPKWPPVGLLLFGPLYLLYNKQYRFALHALIGFVLFRLVVVGLLYAPDLEILIFSDSFKEPFLGLLFFSLVTLFVVPSWPQLFLWFAYTLFLSLAWISNTYPMLDSSEVKDTRTALLSAFSLFLCNFLIGVFMVGIGEVEDYGADLGMFWIWGTLVSLFGALPFWLIYKQMKKASRIKP